MKLKSLTRTVHYPPDDKKFRGEYASVDLEVVTDSGMTVFSWGDGYHDWEKTEGAIEVLQKLFGTVKVKEKQKADADADNY